MVLVPEALEVIVAELVYYDREHQTVFARRIPRAAQSVDVMRNETISRGLRFTGMPQQNATAGAGLRSMAVTVWAAAYERWLARRYYL
jgi:hypothetical protein